ncbi:MAG TPA: 50S ribosomal protein L4 [Candidatus Babeliales bacterium]|nr:50S ribosomal protein L4 [Candidatus Babeliales bacterium]
MSTQTTKKTQKRTASAQGLQAVSLQDLNLESSQKRSVSAAGFATWVRSLLQNWRQGTVACKGRSDVARANRKPWKQKGTGRARAGSARSPLWRGGGVIFGPQARVRTLTVPQKAKQGVLNSILFNYVENGKVACIDWALEGSQPKTAMAFAALKNAGLHDRSITLFLSNNDLLSYASFVNIPNVKILFFDQANACDLVATEQWVVLKKDMDQFKEMAMQWI